MTTFTFGRHAIPDDQPAHNIFAFVCWMSAVVANRRGGRNSQYIQECASFIEDVLNKRLSVRDGLPTDYDWRPCAAVEAAEAMMEYDA